MTSRPQREGVKDSVTTVCKPSYSKTFQGPERGQNDPKLCDVIYGQPQKKNEQWVFKSNFHCNKSQKKDRIESENQFKQISEQIEFDKLFSN